MGFSGLVNGLDKVPNEQGAHHSQADSELDQKFLPCEFFPVGLDVVSQSNQRPSQTAEHRNEQDGFPDDPINDFLPGVRGNEPGRVAEGEPAKGRNPKGGKDAC